MKQSLAFSCVLCLLAGILVGGILPMPWDEDRTPPASTNTILRNPTASDAESVTAFADAAPEPLDSKDNFPLLNTACYALQTLKEQDYAALAALVHPEKGVTFTPYSTVNFESDLTFTQDQIENLSADKTAYIWGLTDGRGSVIKLTMEQYFAEYVFDTDYTQADQIGIDQIVMSGNALENLQEGYPGCRFVDFSIPCRDASKSGLDWRSLKLVFEPGDTSWYLVGMVHGQWTT